MTVYYAYDRQVAFEGTYKECMRWMMDQADCFDGKRFFRTWRLDGDTYYDVGRVYIFNGQE